MSGQEQGWEWSRLQARLRCIGHMQMQYHDRSQSQVASLLQRHVNAKVLEAGNGSNESWQLHIH